MLDCYVISKVYKLFANNVQWRTELASDCWGLPWIEYLLRYVLQGCYIV